MGKVKEMNNNIGVRCLMIEVMRSGFLRGYLMIEWVSIDLCKSWNLYRIVESNLFEGVMDKVKLIDVF